ncbi:MAG: hypothetical protein AB7S26_33555 [Sandaracinaceae bacterium]
MIATERCWACQRNESSFLDVRGRGIALCATCARGLGFAVLSSSPDRLRAIWGLRGATNEWAWPRVDADRRSLRDLQRAHGGDADADWPEHARIHADLALAYREMGLAPDALVHAAISLALDPSTQALETALGAGVAPEMEALRQLLAAHRAS